MKKILSLTLVLVLVLGSFPMAFADNHAKFSDVEDEDVMKAVERLSGFGIVDGYGDGTYKPEAMVTRAEFSKMLVTALGLESAVAVNAGSSKFTDVAGNEWYAGHVNVAAGQGIVGGYPDGSFQPNAQVTYGEAVTMLVRALGYKDEFLAGEWPSNYVAKAASLDITDDVQFFATGNADRGSVSVLVNNTLDANIIEQGSFGDDNNWSEQDDKTLLSENLDIDKFEAVELVSSPKVESTLDSDQVEFKENDDSEMNGYYDKDDSEFDLPNNVEVDEDMLAKLELKLGESLNIYLDGDELAYFETADREYEVVYGTIDDYDNTDEELDLLLVDGDDPSYEYDTDAKVYIDNEKEKDGNNFDNTKNLFGKLVVADNGNVVFADLHDFEDDALIVTDVSDDTFDYIDGTDTDNDFEVDDYDSVVVMSSNGELMSFDDLSENDVVYVNEADHQESGDEVAYLIVSENEAVTEDADKWDTDEFETQDDVYDVADDATLTDDDNDNVYDWSDGTSSTATNILDSVTGDEVEVNLLFNLVNEVRHLNSDHETSSNDMYGIVTDVNYTQSMNASDDYVVDGVNEITVLIESGDEVDYELDFEATDFDGYTEEKDFAKGDTIEFTLNSDGEIDSAELVSNEADSPTNGYSTDDLAADLDDDELELDSAGDLIVDSDVVVLDVYDIGTDYDDAEFVDYEDLVDLGEDDTVIVKKNDNDEVVFMILVDELTTTDEYSAFVDGTSKKDGDTYVDLVLPGGDEATYLVDSDANTNDSAIDVTSDDLIVYEMSGGDIDIQALDSDDYKFKETTSGAVTLDDPFIKFDSTNYKTNSDTIFFDEDSDPMDFDDLEDYQEDFEDDSSKDYELDMLIDGKYIKVLKLD